jgi:hypothetical protein
MPLTFNLTGDKQLQALFETLPKAAQERVLTPLMRKAAALVAETTRAAAPSETGLLRLALGASALREYASGFFVAVGARRGFRRLVTAGARGQLKIARGSRPDAGEEDARNPTQYLHLVTGGRKESVAGARLGGYGEGTDILGHGYRGHFAIPVGARRRASSTILANITSGRFFGKKAAAVPPDDFIDRAFAEAAPQVEAMLAEQAGPLIEAEAAKLNSN